MGDEGHKKWYDKVIVSAPGKFYVPISDNFKEKTLNITLPTDGPKIKYQQGEELLCLVYSLASALHVIGDYVMENLIYESRQDALIYTKRSTVFFLANLMQHGELKNEKVKGKKYEVRKMKEGTLDFDLLVTNQSLNLRIVRVSINHGVTLWSGWIFDSNFQHALPLTKEWLLFVSKQENNFRAFEGRELMVPKIIKMKNEKNI